MGELESPPALDAVTGQFVGMGEWKEWGWDVKRCWWRTGQNPSCTQKAKSKMEIQPHPRAFCIIPKMEDKEKL